MKKNHRILSAQIKITIRDMIRKLTICLGTTSMTNTKYKNYYYAKEQNLIDNISNVI